MQLLLLQFGLLCLLPRPGLFTPTDRRLSLAEEWSSFFHSDGPGSYSFGYDIEDGRNRNIQFKQEEKLPNGTVVGSYGHLEPDGNVKVVRYVADDKGFRSVIEDSKKKSVQHFPPKSMNGGLEPLDEVRSPLIESAVDSLQHLGQNILEEHTPPKFQPGWTAQQGNRMKWPFFNGKW